MQAYASLIAAAAVWFLIHPLVAGSDLRRKIAASIGERGFRGLFALLSIAALSWLIYAFSRAPYEPLWVTPQALFFLPLIVVPIAFVFLVGAFTVPNPTIVGGEKALERAEPARGMLRVTRHPFLWSVILWSFTHLIVRGNVRAVLLFGALLLTAAVGTRDIDKKRARTQGERWARFASVTSNVPFGAIISGRNRLVLRELVLPLVIGLILASAMLHFHTRLFGLSALRAVH
jgi:uncharacterized membrane protein